MGGANPWGRKTKFGNKKTVQHGKTFSSKLEAALYDYLLLLEQRGEISDIRCQPNVYLTDARILFIPDFVATETSTGADVYFEAKGFTTAVYQIKRRLWKVYGLGTLHVFKGSASRLVAFETIVPKPPKYANIEKIVYKKFMEE